MSDVERTSRNRYISIFPRACAVNSWRFIPGVFIDPHQDRHFSSAFPTWRRRSAGAIRERNRIIRSGIETRGVSNEYARSSNRRCTQITRKYSAPYCAAFLKDLILNVKGTHLAAAPRRATPQSDRYRPGLGRPGYHVYGHIFTYASHSRTSHCAPSVVPCPTNACVSVWVYAFIHGLASGTYSGLEKMSVRSYSCDYEESPGNWIESYWFSIKSFFHVPNT